MLPPTTVACGHLAATPPPLFCVGACRLLAHADFRLVSASRAGRPPHHPLPSPFRAATWHPKPDPPSFPSSPPTILKREPLHLMPPFVFPPSMSSNPPLHSTAPPLAPPASSPPQLSKSCRRHQKSPVPPFPPLLPVSSELGPPSLSSSVPPHPLVNLSGCRTSPPSSLHHRGDAASVEPTCHSTPPRPSGEPRSTSPCPACFPCSTDVHAAAAAAPRPLAMPRCPKAPASAVTTPGERAHRA
jgi:hypothetical protein